MYTNNPPVPLPIAQQVPYRIGTFLQRKGWIMQGFEPQSGQPLYYKLVEGTYPSYCSWTEALLIEMSSVYLDLEA